MGEISEEDSPGFADNRRPTRLATGCPVGAQMVPEDVVQCSAVVGTWQSAGEAAPCVVTVAFHDDGTGWLSVRYPFGGGIRCDFVYRLDGGDDAVLFQGGEFLGRAQVAADRRLFLRVVPNPFLENCELLPQFQTVGYASA